MCRWPLLCVQVDIAFFMWSLLSVQVAVTVCTGGCCRLHRQLLQFVKVDINVCVGGYCCLLRWLLLTVKVAVTTCLDGCHLLFKGAINACFTWILPPFTVTNHLFATVQGTVTTCLRLRVLLPSVSMTITTNLRLYCEDLYMLAYLGWFFLCICLS